MPGLARDAGRFLWLSDDSEHLCSRDQWSQKEACISLCAREYSRRDMLDDRDHGKRTMERGLVVADVRGGIY